MTFSGNATRAPAKQSVLLQMLDVHIFWIGHRSRWIVKHKKKCQHSFDRHSASPLSKCCAKFESRFRGEWSDWQGKRLVYEKQSKRSVRLDRCIFPFKYISTAIYFVSMTKCARSGILCRFDRWVGRFLVYITIN